MRIGILGGTFDPPHLGHLHLAKTAMEKAGLGKVLWVITPVPPHKLDEKITPFDIRVEMVKAEIEGVAGFEISKIEAERPGPHYAVDTMRILKERYPDSSLNYVMGGDSLRDLLTWHDPAGFLDAVDGLIVLRRPGTPFSLDQLEMALPNITRKVTFIHTELMEISASEIRRRVRYGEPYEQMLTPGVARLIMTHHLY
jgi:nicotinate-nucleotide adenylyltransferase